MTSLDVSSPDKAIAAEHWYRHRATVENIFRDSKLGMPAFPGILPDSAAPARLPKKRTTRHK